MFFSNYTLKIKLLAAPIILLSVKCSQISPQLLDKLKKSERERQHVYFRRKKEDARETMEGVDLVTINVTGVEVSGEKTSPLTNQIFSTKIKKIYTLALLNVSLAVGKRVQLCHNCQNYSVIPCHALFFRGQFAFLDCTAPKISACSRLKCFVFVLSNL